MAAFTSSWPPDPLVLQNLAAGISKSSTIVQFAVGACVVFVQDLLFGSEAGRVSVIGRLVPALEGLLTALSRMRLPGIDSPTPVLRLDSGGLGDVPVLDSFVSPGFGLTGNTSRTTDERMGTSLTRHGDFDPQTPNTTYMVSATGWMLLALLTGAWIIVGRILLTGGRTSWRASVHGVHSKGFCSSSGENPEATIADGEEEKDLDNGSNDSDDDDPPGPSSSLRYDADGNEGIEWKHFGLIFLLGYLFATMLKALKKPKTKVEAQRCNPSVGFNQKIGNSDYGIEWDVLNVLDGIHDVGFPLRSASANSCHTISLLEILATKFRLVFGAGPFDKAVEKNRGPLQNQTSTVVSARSPIVSEKIWSVIKKVRSKVDLKQSTAAIQIYFEGILETFGLLDFAILVIMPTIVTALRYRYDGHDDTAKDSVVAYEDIEQQHLLDHGPVPSPPIRQEGDEGDGFVSLGSTPLIMPNQNNSRQIDIVASRRFIETCHNPWKLNHLDENCDECVESVITKAVRIINVELEEESSGLVKNREFGMQVVTQLTTFAAGVTGENPASSDTSEHRARTNLDTRMGTSKGGEWDDPTEMADDGSDVESYATADSDVDRQVETGMCSGKLSDATDRREPKYIDGNEIGDPSGIFSGSFSAISESPVRSHRQSIFGQDLSGSEPLLASVGVDFGLPRSNLIAEIQPSASTASAFRTPPQVWTKTLPSSPPAVPRGRKIRLKEKWLKEQETHEAGLELDGLFDTEAMDQSSSSLSDE